MREGRSWGQSRVLVGRNVSMMEMRGDIVCVHKHRLMTLLISGKCMLMGKKISLLDSTQRTNSNPFLVVRACACISKILQNKLPPPFSQTSLQNSNFEMLYIMRPTMLLD